MTSNSKSSWLLQLNVIAWCFVASSAVQSVCYYGHDSESMKSGANDVVVLPQVSRRLDWWWW